MAEMYSHTLLQIEDMITYAAMDKVSLWKDESGRFYVRYPVKEKYKLSELASDDFADWLYVNQSPLRSKSGGTTTSPLPYFRQRVKELVARAKYDDEIPETKLLSRAGHYNNKIYLCLYSKAHEVVEISAQGWSVIDESEAPVLFVPNATASELPVPQHGGSLRQLSNLVNMDKQDFRLLVLWLLAVLNPSIECPILSISAGYGAGKTTLTRFIKSLIDPDNAGELAPFSREDDLYAASSSRYVISVDNVSKISKKWSDIYCRLTTGAGAVKRKNYTNNEAFDLRVRNPLILNGIDFDPVFPDLRDRCLFIRLKQPKERKSKHELEERFNAIRPQILGALLDAVVAALSNTKYILERDICFRMLDTAEFAMRAADAGALPFTKAELRESLEARNSEVKAEELMNDPVCRAVYEIVNEMLSVRLESGENDSCVEMHSCILWEKVMARAKSYAKMPKDVPNSASSFGKRLSAIKGLLQVNGISFMTEHTRSGTKISFGKVSSQDIAEDANTSSGVATTSISDSVSAESEVSASCERRQTPPVAVPDRPENGAACCDTPTGNTSARRITEIDSTSELADILAGEFGL